MHVCCFRDTAASPCRSPRRGNRADRPVVSAPSGAQRQPSLHAQMPTVHRDRQRLRPWQLLLPVDAIAVHQWVTISQWQCSIQPRRFADTPTQFSGAVSVRSGKSQPPQHGFAWEIRPALAEHRVVETSGRSFDEHYERRDGRDRRPLRAAQHHGVLYRHGYFRNGRSHGESCDERLLCKW